MVVVVDNIVDSIVGSIADNIADSIVGRGIDIDCCLGRSNIVLVVGVVDDDDDAAADDDGGGHVDAIGARQSRPNFGILAPSVVVDVVA